MKRHTKFVLELLGGGFALVAVLAAAAALILATGSVPLDFLAPYLGAALSNPASDVRVTVAHARMALRQGPRLEIIARDVELRVGAGGPQIALPELAVDLSVGAALRGVIAPTRIALERPLLRLARDKGGEFHLGLDSAADASTEASLGQVLRDLSRPPHQGAPLGALTELTIRNARFLFDDQALGVVWRAGADLALHRDERGLRSDVTIATDDSGGPAVLRGEIDYVQATARLEARFDFTGLLPATWAAASPALAPLAALDLPISGTMRATLDSSRVAIVAASCDLQLGAGALRTAAMPGGALGISDGAVAASYDPTNGRIALEHFALDLGGPRISASGTIDGVGAGLLAGAWARVLDASLALDASDVPVAALPRLWPKTLSPDARRWVLANVLSGTAVRATARLGLHVDPDAPAAVDLRELSGTLAYRDVAVDFLGKLPPARGIDGTATFDLAAMEFAPTNGAVLGLRISDANISLSKLDVPDSRIAIAFALAGPLKDALVVLDAEPLGYARALGIAAADVAGDVAAHVNFTFPLGDRLELRQVGFAANATLSGVAIPRAVLGRDVSAGTFRLRLDRDAVQLDGSAALAGVPVTLSVRRSLAANPAERLSATLHARLDGDARRALGVDFFPDAVSGPVGIDFTYATISATAAQALVSLDFGESGLTIAPLGWSKSAGTPATAQLALSLAGEHVVAVRDMIFAGGGLEARLDAGLSDDGSGSLSRLDVAHLAVGATDAGGTAIRRDDGGWRITVSGRSFDATALADQLSRAASGDAREPAFDLDVRLDRLILGAARAAQNVRARLVGDGTHWQSATVDAVLAGGAPVRLRYGRVAANRRFSLRSDDFGGFLQLLGLADNVRGGRIEVTGIAVDDGPRRRLKLAADGTDYRLVHAPILAQLLSIASFSGIGALLSGDGIPFSRLTADLLYGDDRIVIDDFRTYGGAIGINAHGTVDRQAATLDLTGTLVPAYRLNTVLGNIPIIGDLLLGGEGEGIFGANFRVAGALDDPKVSVNPLSALAPGVLRKLFLFAPRNPGVPTSAR